MDRCSICGMDFSSPSMGGPGICPACDCGIQPDSINHPKNLRPGPFQWVPGPLTAEEVRRIVREELERASSTSSAEQGK